MNKSVVARDLELSIFFFFSFFLFFFFFKKKNKKKNMKNIYGKVFTYICLDKFMRVECQEKGLWALDPMSSTWTQVRILSPGESQKKTFQDWHSTLISSVPQQQSPLPFSQESKVVLALGSPSTLVYYSLSPFLTP